MDSLRSSDIREEMFLPVSKQIEEEIILYNTIRSENHNSIRNGDLASVRARPVLCFEEEVSNLPQNLFFLEINSTRFFGRKLISQSRLENTLLELNCSKIHDYMILGIYNTHETTEDRIRTFYHPLSQEEKIIVFKYLQFVPLAEIFFPYVYLDSTGKDRSSPVNGWALDRTRAENLGVGEKHLRDYTIKRFKELDIDLQGKVVYDPACSTGQFLKTIKKHFPKSYTIGQDLSAEMIEYAKNDLDEVYHADAREDRVPEIYADVIFVRFLNSEVVKRKEAYDIFPKLVKRLKIGGLIVIFGHTPVLLHSSYMESYDLMPLQKIGFDPSIQSIFQYYLFRRFR